MSERAATDFELAMRNPARVFADPDDVVHDTTLSDAQKIRILKSWEYDARELLVAIEENMAATSDSDLLDRVIGALNRIGVRRDLENAPPTKQGGIVTVTKK